MKNTFYIVLALLLLLCSTGLLAQNSRPIVLNPAIGDTLSLSERDYYQLFPRYKEFQFAVFYLNPDSTVNAEVHYLNNGISTDTLIQNYRTSKSLNFHIKARNALEDKSYQTKVERENTNLNSGAYVSIYLEEGNKVSGELLSVRRSSLLILKQEIINNSIETARFDEINKKEIDKIKIKGNSNLGLGIGLGILASVIVGAIIFQSYDDGTFMWGYDAIPPTILAMVGCVSLGVLIGISTSTPDQIINPHDKYEYQILNKYSRYKFDEPDKLNTIE